MRNGKRNAWFSSPTVNRLVARYTLHGRLEGCIHQLEHSSLRDFLPYTGTSETKIPAVEGKHTDMWEKMFRGSTDGLLKYSILSLSRETNGFSYWLSGSIPLCQSKSPMALYLDALSNSPAYLLHKYYIVLALAYRNTCLLLLLV